MEHRAQSMSQKLSDSVVYFRTCIYLPPRVNSDTPWCNFKSSKMIPTNALPLLQMQMCLIFLGTLLSHTILCRFGIPRFTSMSIVGLIFGTTFNESWIMMSERLFYFDSQENLGLFSLFGYMLFLFYIGVKTDMSVVYRTRTRATNIGSIAIMAPFLCGMAVLRFHSSKYLGTIDATKLGMIIALLCGTSFPVLSSVLSDLKILNSELGRLGQSSALVSEMFNIFLTSFLQIVRLMYQFGLLKALICTASTILFVFLVIFIIRPATFWIIKQTPEGSPVNDHYVYCLLIMALLSSYATHRFGFSALLGPFILGLAIPVGPPLGTAIIKKIETFANEVLTPIFVTTCAMRVDLADFMDWKGKEDGRVDHFMVQTLIIVVVTFAAKFVACMVPPLYSEMPLNDAASLSLVMSCKGIVDMAAISFVRDVIGIPDNVYALLMMCVIVNATFMPMFLGSLYDPKKKYTGYTRRNIIDLRRNMELRVLTCIHRSDNIPPTINLLEATYPTREEPLSLYVLQLLELIGRASPVFICHQLQKKKADCNSSMAEKLLDAFRNFEREFKDAIIVNTFTAISPAEMMYDDICSLALDKFTSLIVLPFHRKWSSDGNSIELEDESIRDLNYLVMERAPCSVGVLIERAQMTHIFSPETPYTVCLLFIGGKDDREALFFAKRMTKNPHVRLTVVRFLASDGDSNDWQTLLDTELLNEIKMKNKVGDAYVKYIEEIVKDGPETALVIRSLVTEYDLIIVGRQARIETPQTSGLLQWSEYPELGVLGDLLASTDAAGKASVFVIQQQRTAMDV